MSLPVQMSFRFKSAICGMMLGDGGVFLGKASKNAHMYMTHADAQHEYLQYKAEILGQLTSTVARHSTVLLPETGKEYGRYIMETKSHPFYTELRKEWYPDGKKIVPEKWMKYLDAEALALWYMDDGCLGFTKRTLVDGNRSISGRRVSLSTYSFSYEDNKLLSDTMFDRFGFLLKPARDRGRWRLQCAATEGAKLIEVVRPHIIPLFAYKIDMKYRVG